MNIQEINKNIEHIKSILGEVNNTNLEFKQKNSFIYLIFNFIISFMFLFLTYQTHIYSVQNNYNDMAAYTFVILFGLIIPCIVLPFACIDYFDRHFIFKLFSNKKNEDSFLLKKYKQYYYQNR